MDFFFHVDGMADPAAAVGGDGIRVLLVLKGRQIVSVPAENIYRRINCMWRPVAGDAHDAGISSAYPVKQIIAFAPGIKRVLIGFGLVEIKMTVEAVRQIDPGRTRTNLL